MTRSRELTYYFHPVYKPLPHHGNQPLASINVKTPSNSKTIENSSESNHQVDKIIYILSTVMQTGINVH